MRTRLVPRDGGTQPARIKNCKTEELKGVYSALAADLAKEEHRKQLLKDALETPLDALANLLSYAGKTAEPTRLPFLRD